MNQGIMFFRCIAEAIRAGYQVYDRCRDGSYLVRARTSKGWALAIVRPQAA
jgi:hypothetical protein